MPPNLPNPVTLIGGFFSGLANYLNNRAIRHTIDDIVTFLWDFVNVFEGVVVELAQMFRRTQIAEQARTSALSHTGGDIQGIGIDSHDMWHHLRYVLMPNTINYVLNWVWSNWIKQLRQGLVNTIGWTARWNWYQQHWINDNRAYTRALQVTGRSWREQYVYPQLAFLLSPWRVASNYAQPITTAVARYLNYTPHHETRDTVSRVVYSDMSRLWQSFDRHLAEWLLTDVSAYGWGSGVPDFPPGADVPPPRGSPSVWEPFVKEPPEPPYPAGSPDVPRVDYSY